MLPTLRSGECLVVRRGGRVRPGAVVLARLRERPALLVVKRAVEPADGGWLLASDNPAVAGHGLTGGVGDVEGVVVLRYWPLPPRLVPPDPPRVPA
ncbi:MAG: S24 family peptidase [Actinomycetota bacterium]|nr:S24 family peptidase [Actinomycetota bacterium]